jgi:hypothetical protein
MLWSPDMTTGIAYKHASLNNIEMHHYKDDLLKVFENV